DFYQVMGAELRRLDRLINQLLEVGRLDAVGLGTEPEDVPLEPLIRRAAEMATVHHKLVEAEVFQYDCDPVIIHARRLVLEMIFGNLLDNAVKYGGAEPRVEIEVRLAGPGRVRVRIADNGDGVPSQLRKRIFRMFYRGGSELERRQKGTGLGLYIVRTLVHMLKGRISVVNRTGQNGSVFEVELP
ncbi:MAG: HAMP domain-containing histidine kinase, partial [Planctomycetaceae bacterium]|nr:HAMP domain-containing histidine kinase [Planctomycetaceae bacterium]